MATTSASWMEQTLDFSKTLKQISQSAVQASGCVVGVVGVAASIIALAEKAIASIVPDLRDHVITSANVPNIVYLDVSPEQATAACIDVNRRLGNNV